MEQQESTDLNSELASEFAEVDDIESLKRALAEERDKSSANLAGWQRAQADLINYKRRVDQEKEEIGRFGNAAIMLSILPILDDFERAIASVPDDLAKHNWVDGMILIERKLQSSLEKQGLCQIKALGELFDPNLHEAVMQGKGKEGMVVEEMEKGYKLNGRLIRPSKVIVGSGEEKEE
ncbi:MAG: nucleotide exchange factor GrpE [Dehalococcoidales bacterium]|nr:nucleotide exchange factor GrpE [Dehalococcoidales bacterium]